MKVDGKVVIITGSSSGFGKALAEKLIGKGAKLVLGDIAEGPGRAVEKECNAKKPGNAVFVKCDVTKSEDVKNLFVVAKKHFGGFDIMVNNAGIGERGPFAQDVKDAWVKVVDIDLTAVILGTRIALTELIAARKPGVILNTASLAGLYPVPHQPVYAAVKGGVVHFTRSLAQFAQSHNIRVNAICPSFSPTGILEDAHRIYGSEMKKVTDAALVPVSLVIDAFEKAIEDESLAGACLRVTPQYGVDQYSWRKSKM
ncbi:hypothetical protein HK104_000384 [Borealophlyctis nickersoniae]|nr:hypothetical protein HK104_000384 [Borealophlyctis nickersoniae]